MMATVETWRAAAAASLFDAFRGAVADDLRTLAALQDREIDRSAITLLKDLSFPDNLGLRLISEPAAQAAGVMRAALGELPTDLGADLLDELAVDFAEIYLTHVLRAAPTESVWLDRDHLDRQEPMFAVRSYYRRHGLRVVDWARRPDDHLVTQLEFLAYLLEGGEGDVAKEAAAFLDEHLRRWIGRFSRRVAQQCRTSFYAALALLTSAYVEELRSVLSALLSAPQPSRDELETLLAGGASADLPMPINGASVGPGW